MPSPHKPWTANGDSPSALNRNGDERLNPKDRTHLEAIDASIERMRKLTSTDPSVLSIKQDSDKRYRYTWQFQATQWLDHTPFDDREHDGIQYQTFVVHDPSRSLYTLEPLRPPEHLNGSAVAPVKAPKAGPKKTITLSAYKKKQALGAATPDAAAVKDKAKDLSKASTPVPPHASQIPAQKHGMDEEAITTSETNGELKALKPLPMPGGEFGELKRKREDDVMKRTPVKKARVEDAVAAPEPASAKKVGSSPSPVKQERRSSPEIKRDTPVETASGYQQGDSTTAKKFIAKPEKSPRPPSPIDTKHRDTGMPPKLSPLLLPQHGKSDMSALPPRLSPTLPDNILSSLQARAHESPSSPKMPPSKQKLLTPNKSVEGPLKRKSPTPRNGFRANSVSPVVRSDVENRAARKKPKLASRSSTPEDSQDERHAVSRIGNHQPNDSDQQRLIVKLHVPKLRESNKGKSLTNKLKEARGAMQRSVESGSGNPAGSARHQTGNNMQQGDEQGTRSVTQKGRPAHASYEAARRNAEALRTAVEKRVRPTADGDTEARTAKRTKVDAAPITERDRKIKKEPSTPLHSAVASPTTADHVAQKHFTPNIRREALPARREVSSATPSGHSTSPATVNSTAPPPSLSSQHSSSQLHTGSRPSNKTPMQAAWLAEQQRLQALGRELKHASTAHHGEAENTNKPSSSSTEAKLSAITSLESLLVYLLAFTASDRSARTADPKTAPSIQPWRSLVGYYTNVRKACEPFPLLHGLASALGVVFHSHLLDLVAHARSSLFSTDARSSRESQLADGTDALRRAALDAEAHLGIDALMDNFPKTWAGRARGSATLSTSSAPAIEKLDPASTRWWTGDYHLPIGLQTSPVRAVRAGCALLEEWIEREAVDYKIRFKV